MEHKSKILLVILLCICLNQLALGRNNPSVEPVSPIAPLIVAAALPSPTHSSFEALIAFIEEEPILLLLGGLMLFAGATTIRRKRSRSREQAPKSVGTSI